MGIIELNAMPLALPVLHPRPKLPHGEARPPRAPAHAHAEGVLRDSHSRVIRDLRLSITDRCNFRCVYCMDPDVRFLPPDDLLSVDDIDRLIRVAASLGVRKVRLTGGETTLHPRLTEIIRCVARHAIRDIALTTNGVLLTRDALDEWKSAGLSRITISIDSLREDRFTAITRSRSSPADVLNAISLAQSAGLDPVKVNAVIIRDVNDDEVVDLARLARDHGVEMRLIEFMPLDSGHRWSRDRVVSAAEIIERIDRVFALTPTDTDAHDSTASTYRFTDGVPGSVGVIAPVSRPFCGACSRLRITADAMVRPCLFSTREWGLRSLLRDGGSDAEIRAFLVDAVWSKQAGHAIGTGTFEQPRRPMAAIGG